MDICDPLQSYVQKLIDEDDRRPISVATPKPTATSAPEGTEPAENTPPPDTDPPESASTDTDTAPDQGAEAANGVYIRFLQGEDGPRQYTDAQRALFSEYKSALKELKNLYSTADKEAKKAANRKSNSLNSVSNSLLDQMIKVQDLAIAVANSFNYTKVKNIGKTCYPNQTHTDSPWALDYWTDKKFNAVKVNFN